MEYTELIDRVKKDETCASAYGGHTCRKNQNQRNQAYWMEQGHIQNSDF